jgi:hypothetical protein
MLARTLLVLLSVLASALPASAVPPDSCDPRENFKWLISQPEVKEHLNQLMEEAMSASKGKSQEEMAALFEKKKMEYGAILKMRAKESVPKTCPTP